MEDRILHHYLDEFRIGCDLDPAEAETLFDALIGSEDHILIAEVLSAWNEKGTTEDELFALASLIRSRMKRINSTHESCVDVVGTGGSQVKTFNVSTVACFVIAGAGVPVAKHGNRAATSKSGSTDVLSELGIDIDVDPAISEKSLTEHDICFMFAPRYHSFSPTLAMARRYLGRPTIFNNLGPLCNPASAPHHVIGVWHPDMVGKTANVLHRLGTGRSWIVHGQSGLDEIALKGSTRVAEINGNSIDQFEITAADFGVYTLGKDLPSKSTAGESAARIRAILNNEMKDRDSERLVLINAAAAIFVTGQAESLPDAYKAAENSLRAGAAAEKFNIMAGLTK